MNFVTKKKLAQDSGLSVRTIEGWIYSGKLVRDKHYVVVGKTTLININEVNTWLSDQSSLASTQKTVESELGFRATSKARDNGSKSTQKAIQGFPHKLIWNEPAD